MTTQIYLGKISDSEAIRWMVNLHGKTNAAKILCVSQSRIPDLMRGKWERFSREMLVTLATRAGMHVRLETAA
jgi:predicted XRE-type DNA-binding protein